ncbi:MAG: hypothetical protein JNN07_01225 [Verrucomicrobiales bacterium]|nr:hypothetical protein [Verrucomicrobiales bacterium]
MTSLNRRLFLRSGACGVAGLAALSQLPRVVGQSNGDRPSSARGDVTVLNPQGRVPVGLIIDDSTCLVNLNRFAMPQFDQAWEHGAAVYHRKWRDWPVEIPDRFVRKFAEWCSDQGVKGKYSIVPFPACVGRLDRMLPGWTQRELQESLQVVREWMLPNWDIHPEMVTHTRVIDTKTGHPHTDHSLKFMENWEWTTGRSVDEIADYLAYALRILKNVGLPCEGVTTPGGFGGKALVQLSQASLQSVRDVYQAEVPHYFRHLYSEGKESVAPRVENASGLDGSDPRCVVSIVGCAGDWTGGWDNTPPGGADKFITADLQSGRMVDIIRRGEPALMLAHWTGIYWNGEEQGFKVFQEVVRRLKARYDHLIWMKLSEISRYWAAKELTQIARTARDIRFQAPFACSQFTVRFLAGANSVPTLGGMPLVEVSGPFKLKPGSWCRDHQSIIVCFALPRGSSQIELVG